MSFKCYIYYLYKYYEIMCDGLQLKRGSITYDEKLENIFSATLYNFIKKECTIKPTINKFDYVDFIITSRKDPKKVLYVELKCRNVKYKNVKSMIIGYPKMCNITLCELMPCLLVWSFGDEYKCVEYNSSFINYNTRVVQNSKVIDIPVSPSCINIERLSEIILNKMS